MFCCDHAPLIDLVQCLPPDLYRIFSTNPELSIKYEVVDKAGIRLCKTCKFEIMHAEGIFQEVWDNKEKLTFLYWQNVVFEGQASSLLEDCPFPISVEDIDVFVENAQHQSVHGTAQGKEIKKKRFFTRGKWTKLFEVDSR